MLSRVNTLEEGKGGPKNDTEERAKIESALTSLHQRISELEKGKGSGDMLHALSCLQRHCLPGSCSLAWPLVPDPLCNPSQSGLPAQFLGCRYLSGDASALKKGLYSPVRTLAGFFFKSDLFNLQQLCTEAVSGPSLP